MTEDEKPKKKPFYKQKWFKYIRYAVYIYAFISFIGDFPGVVNQFRVVSIDIADVVRGTASVGDIFDEGEKDVEVVNIDPGKDCSNITTQWRPDENVYFDEEHKIRLADGSKAGSMTFKKKVSNLLTLEMTFRSNLTTGVNTNISLKNEDGELKYAIGDGDFKTVRYSYVGQDELISDGETVLQSEIDNNEDISFKLNIIEGGKNNRAISSLIYTGTTGGKIPHGLEDIIMPNPEKISLSLGFGLDARKESNLEEAYIDIISCTIWESQPSKVFD